MMLTTDANNGAPQDSSQFGLQAFVGSKKIKLTGPPPLAFAKKKARTG
jgi:hypothetical protein